MATYEQMLMATIMDPPDPNEPQPPANRRNVIYGNVIGFLILAWGAVLFRLWVRIKVVREPGLDDVFIAISALLGVAGGTCVCLSVEHGLGNHMLYLGAADIRQYLMLFYIENGIYVMQTTIVKISLLLQFLRIFKAGTMRWVCIIEITVVSLWGLAFFIIAWFPCFPIRGTWDRDIGATCYGFGLGDVQEFILMFKFHSASNMVLDFAVFLTPMIIFRSPSLKIKNVVGLIGVFSFGAIAVAISVWRLTAISRNQAATYPYIDFTWFAPLMIVLSCLEIDFALICASMPVFWPIIENRFTAIFVQYEVNVTEEPARDDYGLAYELEHTKSAGQTSLRSVSGTSMEGLTKDDEDLKTDPNRKFTVGPDPLEEHPQGGASHQTVVETRPKPKWEL